MADARSLTGQTVSHYHIFEKLGAGGMGEVYRATDSRLGRDVAIKILPEAFGSDPQRMSRFEREAQLLAALNHPNIATIYGLELAGDSRALAMELVPGPTLADRIAQGPMPLEETLPIARQIAEALEYAHERGIIHRDLKPANVKVTPEGKVKLLDFGLAKALADDPAAADLSSSPTLTAAATRAGLILGTAGYMSPEQARGKAVDRRADIWSFGVVLFEMLAGAQAFGGETISDTLAAVIKEEPDWKRLPASTPGAIRRLLRRSTEKDAKRRLQAIGEARIAIEDYLAHPGEEPAAGSGAAASAPARLVPEPLWKRAVPWAGMALFAFLAAAGFLRLWMRGADTEPRVALRLASDIGAPGALFTTFGSSEVLSPDGTRIVYVVKSADGKHQLYVRELDQLQAVALSDTTGARDPFFSPDGEWIGFFTDEKLKKVSVRGGAAVTLCDAITGRGASWREDGTIVFAPLTRGALSRVSSAGGTPEELTKLDAAANELTHRWPQVLPGGKAVLYTVSATFGSFEDSGLVVQELPTGPKKTIYRGGFYGRYLPSGHVVFMHEGTLFAMPFDLKKLEPAGQAAPVVEEVMSSPDYGGAQFSFSENGALAYLRGKSSGVPVMIEWMGRDGKMQPLRQTPAEVGNISFSPDGKRLAMELSDAGRTDIWTYDWQRDTLARLTFTGERNFSPVWTPDGQRIAYTTIDKGDTYGMYWKRADGAGDAQRLTQSTKAQYPRSWSPDGKVLAIFMNLGTATSWDLYTITMEGGEKTGWKPGEPKLFLGTPAVEVLPVFSPDGKWIAYQSNESGTYEIYVRPFPGPGGKWQISSGGGVLPQWSQTSKELFYRTEKQQIMSVAYTSSGDSFQAGKPALWSEGQFTDRGLATNFAPHPDGKRFAVLKGAGDEAQQEFSKIVYVSNFFDELRRKVPPKK